MSIIIKVKSLISEHTGLNAVFKLDTIFMPPGYSWKRLCLPLWKGKGYCWSLDKVCNKFFLLGEFFSFKTEEVETIKKKNIIVMVIIILVAAAIISVNFFADDYQSVLNEHGYSKADRIKHAESEQIIRVYHTEEGIVQIVAVQGYKSVIRLLVAINDEHVQNVAILSHNETPDYGGYIVEDWFLARLLLPVNQQLSLVKVAKKNSNDVVAVTGATISSKAVVTGVNLCIENYGGINQ